MEDVTLLVTNVTLLESVFLEQGARAMLQHVQKNVRVHTFPPSTPPSSSHLQQEVDAASALRCDLNAMLLLEATHRTLQDEINSAGASSSKTTFDGNSWWKLLYPSAFPPLTGGVRKPSLLTPLCQFRLAGGSQSTTTDVSSLEGAVSHHAGLEAWWRLFQQRDASASVLSHVNLDIHEGHDDASPVSATLSSPPVVTFDAICRIERRYLEDPVCLGVQGAAGLVNSNITITSTLRFDLLWWYLFLAMVAATVLSPLFSKYSTLQVALCFVLGVVVMLCVAIFFVAKDLHRTRIGKAGILAVIASGGVMLAVEGLATALLSLIAHELQTNSAVHAFVALAGVVSAVLSRYLFGAFLREITRAVFATVQLSLLVFMYLVNADATIVTVMGVCPVALFIRCVPARNHTCCVCHCAAVVAGVHVPGECRCDDCYGDGGCCAETATTPNGHHHRASPCVVVLRVSRRCFRGTSVRRWSRLG
ncbi:transmembrane protein, putative [Bodo saltans]|uniref:Transmembrane protein, putative n=1 Tax=Bodo saltans TaxID=75058 RepID=A0A0S4IV07_BODSA|nr:transmembrane protein, putative [Bodo saltans]|eukprot:CUG14797.1 transmembrane protein, putative [Bodo saltans]